MFLETSRGKVGGFILSLGVRGCQRSLEVARGQMLKCTKPKHMIPFWRALEISLLVF